MVSSHLAYTSVLDRTRTVIHELQRARRHGAVTHCLTKTGLELVVDAKGNVSVVAGEGRRRRRCGYGGVVN